MRTTFLLLLSLLVVGGCSPSRVGRPDAPPPGQSQPSLSNSRLPDPRAPSSSAPSSVGSSAPAEDSAPAPSSSLAAATLARDHDHFKTRPVDVSRSFLAFEVSFDGPDDGEKLGVPEWVAYEVRSKPANLGPSPARPSKWATDAQLHSQGIAPNDDTYSGSGYSRGHMCPKQLAHWVSDDADRETHTVLNACPQLQGMNNGVWKGIEELTGSWADEFGKVWVVTGPVFLRGMQRRAIGDAGEVPAAIPDAFYKVVAREQGAAVVVLAFLVPMEGDDSLSKTSADVRPYLTSVDVLEALTDLDFLTALDDSKEADVEKRLFTELWPCELLRSREAKPAPAGADSPEVSRADGHSPDRTATVPAAADPQAAPVRRAPVPVVVAPPTTAADPLASVTLRGGANPTATQELLAKRIKAAGWEYMMPRPKSAQARWGNGDGRTTWFVGYWVNRTTGAYSSSQPSEAGGFKGDGVQNTGWRRGGSPSAPTTIEWLHDGFGTPWWLPATWTPPVRVVLANPLVEWVSEGPNEACGGAPDAPDDRRSAGAPLRLVVGPPGGPRRLKGAQGGPR